MNQIILVLALATVLFLSVCATAVPLYEIQKDGKTNWILGTFHMPVDSDELPQSVKDASKQAKTFVSEAGSPERIHTIAKSEWDIGYLAVSAPPIRSLRADSILKH